MKGALRICKEAIVSLAWLRLRLLFLETRLGEKNEREIYADQRSGGLHWTGRN